VQASCRRAVSKPPHGLDQIADLSRHRPREVPQIVQAHPRHAYGFARGTESIADHSTIDMATAPCWHKQQRLAISINEPFQMLADGGAE
jgi:hypothetical protein